MTSKLISAGLRTRSPPMVLATPVLIMAPAGIEARCHHDGVARCNGPRRYARRDGIGRIVEAINIIKENGQQNDGPN